MIGMESRLVRACGCVVDTAEDGVASTAWCSEHANAAAVAMTNRERAKEVCRELAAIAASFAIGASPAACHEASLSAVERAIDAANRAAVDVKPGATTALLEMETRIAELAAERTALTAEITQLQESLRMEWWANHGCSQSGMYGDDGERSCGICLGDFKRMPFEHLRAHVQGTRNKRLVAALAKGGT